METIRIDVARREARDLYREYKKHQHYSEPMDWEIQRAYQLIAQGRVIIKALESIPAAGVNEEGLPKLAIARADAKTLKLKMWTDGSTEMHSGEWRQHRSTNQRFAFPAGTFPPVKNHRWNHEAIVPLIPVHLRPKRGLANYHILFEAEWRRIPPRDPYLLRRIGKGDMWLVVARVGSDRGRAGGNGSAHHRVNITLTGRAT